jgi:hypothetical protein
LGISRNTLKKYLLSDEPLWMAVENRVILAARRNSDDLPSVVHSSFWSQQQSGGKGG